LGEVIIDGKDFLYTVFQLWDRDGIGHHDRVRAYLSTLFGPEGLEADISWRHERALKIKGTRWNKVIGSNHHPMTPIA
jgi:hypothetical protein